MGIPLKNQLWFIGDNKGRTARMVSGVAKMLGGPPVPLSNNPDGWRDLEVGGATDAKYRTLNRTATIAITFVGDGADILRYYMYKGRGFQEELWVILLQKSETNGKYLLEYRGRLDLPKAKDDVEIGVQVNAKEGGPASYIAANESQVYSIDSTSANPIGFSGYFDGMTFKDRIKYIFGSPEGSTFDLSNDFNNVFPLVFGGNEGFSFDLIKNESILPEFFSSGDLAEYLRSNNYHFYRPYTTVVDADGQIVWWVSSGPGTFHVDLYWYTSLGNRYDILINQPVGGTAVTPEIITIPSTEIELEPDEKLFLFITRYEGGGLYTIQIKEGTQINYTVKTKNQPTTAIGFRPIDLWRELVSRISGGVCTGESEYFTDNFVIPSLFSGQSLRNLTKANLQISFEKFYQFYDALRPMGLKIVGKTIYIEPLENIYGDGPTLLDFGEASKVSLSFAFDALFNSATVGYQSLNIQELNGVPEYNSKNNYSLPIDSLKADYNRLTEIIGAPSEIEKTRSTANTLDSTNNPRDNTIFAVAFGDEQDADGNFLLNRSGYTIVSGTIDNTVYNIIGMTPNRMIRAAGVILSPVLEQLGGAVVKFEAADKKNELVTIEGGVTIAEQMDIAKGNLAAGIWHPYDIEFESPTPEGYAEILENLNKGLVIISYLGTEIKVLPIGNISSKPATSEPQQGKLRISVQTPLSTLQSLSLQGIYSIDSLDNTIFISDLNPVHLSRYGTNTNRFQGVYDNQFQLRNENYQTQPAYLQKWVKTRAMPFQFVTSGYGLLTLKIYDANGTLVDTENCTLVANDAVLIPYVLQQVELDLSALDGRYTIVVFDGSTPLFISEWIDIAESWPNCHEIFYYDTKNRFNTYWDEFRPSIFVESTILPLQPQVDGTEYIDELKNNETLDGRTWDMRTLQLGGKSNIGGNIDGIPDWMARKLNIILILNRWSIDGYRWSKAKNEALQPVFAANSPTNVYTIDISPSTAVTGLVFTGTPEPLTESFIATMDASSFGIDGGGIIDIEVTTD